MTIWAWRTKTPRFRPDIPRGRAIESRNLPVRSRRRPQAGNRSFNNLIHTDPKHRRRVGGPPLVADFFRPCLAEDYGSRNKGTVASRIGGTIEANYRGSEGR